MSGEGRWQTVGKKDHHQRRSVKGREERAPARDGIGQCMRRVSSHLFLLFSMTFLPTFNKPPLPFLSGAARVLGCVQSVW